MKLRAYQGTARDLILAEYEAGRRSVLAVQATGLGKTILAASVADTFLPRGRVLALAHRDELIRQAAEKFRIVTGEWPEIEKGDEWVDENSLHGKAKIVVSSFQTQSSGRDEKKRMHRFDPKEFAFLWVDEAHHILAPSYRAVVDYYMNANPELKLLGVTATADRADGLALGQVFESAIAAYELPDAIHDGYLIPVRQRSVVVDGLDFSKCRTLAGDLNALDLEAVMMAEKPLHGVAHASIERACGLPQHSLNSIMNDEDRVAKLAAMLEGKPRRKTLIFAASVAHAVRTAEIINRWIPFSADYVAGDGGEFGISLEERQRRLRDYSQGKIQFLVNCMVATEGYDEPGIEVVVMGRPTKSRALFAQMIGRGTRPLAELAPVLGDLVDSEHRRQAIEQSGKPFVEVLDFVGNSGRHRLVSAVDLLGGEMLDAAIAERAKELAQEQTIDVEQAIELATDEVEEEAAIERMMAEREAKLLAEDDERRQRDDEAKKRAAVVGTSLYQMSEVHGDGRFSTGMVRESSIPKADSGRATEKQIGLLVSLGFPRDKAKRCGVRQAAAIIDKLKGKRCTTWQEQTLRQHGYSGALIAKLNFHEAHEAINSLKQGAA